MNILYLLIPLGLVLLGIAVWAFMWAVRSGQFEDLEGPAHRILMDDDEPQSNTAKLDATEPDSDKSANLKPESPGPDAHLKDKDK